MITEKLPTTEQQESRARFERELDDSINTISRSLSEMIADVTNALTICYNKEDPYRDADMSDEEVNRRVAAAKWCNIASNHFREGMMALRKAAKDPEAF